MFTLKLYRSGPLAPEGRTVIVETVGLWIGHCDGGIKHIQAFKRTVGVMDEDGTPEFYVGGTIDRGPTKASQGDPPSAIVEGVGGNYYDWGVLENAQGKTTEMFR
jgi:hypothetical protein